jgi:nucleoside-diphosphate-sugar epimerase
MGYSKATKALLDSAKLYGLGWKAKYTLPEGIKRAIWILPHWDD